MAAIKTVAIVSLSSGMLGEGFAAHELDIGLRRLRDYSLDIVADPALPIVCNLNVGHAMPRCIAPFGVPAHVDATRQVVEFDWRTA